MAAPRVAVARWHSVPLEGLKYYWQRLREAGLEPFDLSPGSSLDDCSGLVLTGGVDVDPALYGEERHPETQEPDRDRDEFELSHLTRALEVDIPVLAICRGQQLLNVCLGGKLLQHIEGSAHNIHEDRTSSWHAVDLVPGTRLHAVLPYEKLQVNSRHHQSVTEMSLAPGSRVTATSPDGLVEGVESGNHTWVVGVQWHPERSEPEVLRFAAQSARVFEALAESTRPPKTSKAHSRSS